MFLMDPPYSSGGITLSARKQPTGKKYLNRDGTSLPDFFGDAMDSRAYCFYMREVLFTAFNKTKPGGILCVFIDWRNLPAMSDAIQMSGWTWRGILAWDKGTTRGQVGRFRQDCEFIVWASKGKTDNPPDCGAHIFPGCYHISSVIGNKKIHQTQKPVELIKRLLKISGDKWTICDPFMGSGTTGVACLQMGRNFVGFELSKEYYAVAADRLEEQQAEQVHNT